MSDFALPLGFALLVWWTATAIVMFLDGLPQRTFRWTLLGTTVLQAAALYGLWKTRTDTSVAGAYLAFTCAVLTWGWQEIFFLTGAITGPRRSACAAGCSGWRHFRHGVLHHPRIDALVASAGEDQPLLGGPLVGVLLGEPLPRRRRHDQHRLGLVGGRVEQQFVQCLAPRLRLHHHAGAAAVGGVVDGAVPVVGPPAQVVHAHVDQPALNRLTDQRQLQRPEVLGKNRHDVESHHASTSSNNPASSATST